MFNAYVKPTLRQKLLHSPGCFQVEAIDVHGPKFDGDWGAGWWMRVCWILGLK